MYCIFTRTHTHTHTHTHMYNKHTCTHTHTHTCVCRVQETDAREREEMRRVEEEESRRRTIPLPLTDDDESINDFIFDNIEDYYEDIENFPPPPPSLTGLPPPLVYGEPFNDDYEDIECLVIDTGMATVKVCRPHPLCVCVYHPPPL